MTIRYLSSDWHPEVNTSLTASAHLFDSISTSLSICLFVFMSVCLSVCLSVLYLSVFVSVSGFISLLFFCLGFFFVCYSCPT